MANKRSTKKRIRQLCGEAAVQVLTLLPEEIAEKAVCRLACLQTGALAKVSVSFDRTPRDFASRKDYNKALKDYHRAVYVKLNRDFNDELSQIVREINAALTETKQ